MLNRDGKRVFESPVVVGKIMSKTVIFSGNMSYVVFSPYWNVPSSILKSEILPGIKKDKNYLAKHNMEWYEGQVRQFIEFVLSKYVESGVDELDQDKLPILLTNKYQSLQDAQDILGNVGSISKLFIEFQEHLYREGVA